MPQTRLAFKALLASVALLSTAAPALAEGEDAAPDRVQLYVCGTGADAAGGYLSLSGVENPDDNSKFDDLRLDRVSADGQPVWHFPSNGADEKTAFLFSHSSGPEGHLVTVRFTDAGTRYTLYSLYVPPDPNDEGDAGGATGGLVGARDGKLVEDIECGESPYEFIEYMRRSMSCDAASPYASAACEEYEPRRSAPIDIGRIGLD